MAKQWRKNSWHTAKKEFSKGLQDILKGSHPEAPLHVEIHPHHSSTAFCNNNCESCTGLYYRILPRAKTSGINPERLIKTIGSFKGRVKHLFFAGNCIEPLIYPEIVAAINEARKANLEFALYSNFYYASRPGVLDALTSQDAVNDYVRISIDAGSTQAYNLTHSPMDKQSFQRILDNIIALLELKKAKKPNLHVHLTYLLNRYNCSQDDLKFITKWASSHQGIDEIRFSVYQKPLGREMPCSAAIPGPQLDETKELLHNLKQHYDREDFTIDTFVDFLTHEGIVTTQKEKTFKRCYVQHVFSVIGFDGGVYPCTAMAFPDSPDFYRFGNINNEDYWDIWRRIAIEGLFVFPIDRCYDCTRAEFSVNSEIQEMIDMANKGPEDVKPETFKT